MTRKKYLSALSRHSSEAKPKTNLILKLIRETISFLDNKLNKQDVYGINIFKHPQSKNNCWQNGAKIETSKLHYLKSVKINT